MRPEVLYLHNPADKHDTHVACCLRTLAAIRSLPKDRRPQRVLGCEIWRDLDWLNDADKQVLPVDRHKNLAAALSGVFDSQITGGKRYDVAVAGRRMAHATFFESHATDKADALSFAMDLTPLVEDETLDVFDYTLGLLRTVRERGARPLRAARLKDEADGPSKSRWPRAYPWGGPRPQRGSRGVSWPQEAACRSGWRFRSSRAFS